MKDDNVLPLVRFTLGLTPALFDAAITTFGTQVGIINACRQFLAAKARESGIDIPPEDVCLKRGERRDLRNPSPQTVERLREGCRRMRERRAAKIQGRRMLAAQGIAAEKQAEKRERPCSHKTAP